jgi:hypothetical protein
MVFASTGSEIESPPVNGSYSFWIQGQTYHLLSPLHPNEANKSGHGQLHILDSAEAATKQLENQQKQ